MSTYFNPETGESFRFEPGQRPPAGWKPLRPIPEPHPIIAGGGCVLYPPGKEPRLYVNPETGESVWVQFPFLVIPTGWIPLVPLVAPPPMTSDKHEYFSPETGESYRFGPGQQPPRGWKPLKPVPPRDPITAGGGCVLYPPGKEPRLYVNPETGESVWMQFPFLVIPTGWIPLVPIFSPPPMTEDKHEFFNPETGETYRFEPGQEPPAGWKPLKPVPAPHPVIAGGGCVLYPPGREPRLYINPKTGQTRWVQFPYLAIPAGFIPLVQLNAPPPMTNDTRDFFNPATGETDRIEPGTPPPTGWKQLQPVPAPDPVIADGGCVFYRPGKEPRLYVNPKTGQTRWVQFPYEKIPAGWKQLQPRSLAKGDQQPSVDLPVRTPRIVASASSSLLGDIWEFVKELPSAVGETFASGEAYQSYAQAAQSAASTVTFGYFGDAEARARELEAMGFKRPERRVERLDREVLGPVIGVSTALAVGSWVWIRAGGSTFQVAVRWQQWTPPFGHVIYGAEGAWVHATGGWFRMTVSSIAPKVLSNWWILEGVPVLNAGAVTATGGSAWLCFTAAASAFARGWWPR